MLTTSQATNRIQYLEINSSLSINLHNIVCLYYDLKKVIKKKNKIKLRRKARKGNLNNSLMFVCWCAYFFDLKTWIYFGTDFLSSSGSSTSEVSSCTICNCIKIFLSLLTVTQLISELAQVHASSMKMLWCIASLLIYELLVKWDRKCHDFRHTQSRHWIWIKCGWLHINVDHADVFLITYEFSFNYGKRSELFCRILK